MSVKIKSIVYCDMCDKEIDKEPFFAAGIYSEEKERELRVDICNQCSVNILQTLNKEWPRIGAGSFGKTLIRLGVKLRESYEL